VIIINQMGDCSSKEQTTANEQMETLEIKETYFENMPEVKIPL